SLLVTGGGACSASRAPFLRNRAAPLAADFGDNLHRHGDEARALAAASVWVSSTNGEARLLRSARRAARRRSGGNQEGVSAPRDEIPSGPQPERSRGRGEVQGSEGSLRG